MWKPLSEVSLNFRQFCVVRDSATGQTSAAVAWRRPGEFVDPDTGLRLPFEADEVRVDEAGLPAPGKKVLAADPAAAVEDPSAAVEDPFVAEARKAAENTVHRDRGKSAADDPPRRRRSFRGRI